MTPGRFRLLLIAHVLSLFASAALSAAEVGLTPSLVEAYAAATPARFESHAEAYMAFMSAALAIIVAGYVGLWRFRRWGRALTLWSSVVGLLLYPVFGPSVDGAWTSAAYDFSMMSLGALLACAYLSPIRERFQLHSSQSQRPEPMIETITALGHLRERILGWRREGLRIGFVPTMGNLHAGHYSLVALARQHADRVISSVFVNPTQFGPSEDFTRYPRTPEADTSGLEAAGCDALWLPTVESMYPFGVELAVRMRVPGVADVLEGRHRPGHFDGVCTVVARLFNQVQPDVAAFGKKDFQQLAVIQQMVTDLAYPLTLLRGEIVRETDGLAMSSRNQYLNPEERVTATRIHATLMQMREQLCAGTPRAVVEAEASLALVQAGFTVDYAAIRTPDLAEPDAAPVQYTRAGPRVALIAARLGRTRLIDNLEFDSP